MPLADFVIVIKNMIKISHQKDDIHSCNEVVANTLYDFHLYSSRKVRIMLIPIVTILTVLQEGIGG
jgi:hypothetical protein